jgi:hypothetical protein
MRLTNEGAEWIVCTPLVREYVGSRHANIRRSVLITTLPFDEWSLCVASGGQAPIEGVVGTQPLIGGSAELDRPRARAVARRGVRLRVRRTRRPRRGALDGHARPVMPAWSPTTIGRGRPGGGDVDHLAGSGGCFRGEALTANGMFSRRRSAAGEDRRRPAGRICKRGCKPGGAGRGEMGRRSGPRGTFFRASAEAGKVTRDSARRRRRLSYVS